MNISSKQTLKVIHLINNFDLMIIIQLYHHNILDYHWTNNIL